jgi:hypothetical protein
MAIFNVGNRIIEPGTWPWGSRNAKSDLQFSPFALKGLGETEQVVSSFSFTPSSFTVEFWIYPFLNTDYNQSIFSKRGWGSFGFHTDRDGKVYAGIDCYNRFVPSDFDQVVFVPNEWQHLAFSFNQGFASFYRNGELLATRGGLSLPDDFQGISVSKINGLWWEFRLWEVPLSQSEILAGMNVPLSGDEPGLAVYYPFEEGEGATLTDASGNGRDGAIFGATWVER